jgi:hypothetical protein
MVEEKFKRSPLLKWVHTGKAIAEDVILTT